MARTVDTRTQLTEVFYLGLDYVIVELLAVFYGKENGIELPDGA